MTDWPIQIDSTGTFGAHVPFAQPNKCQQISCEHDTSQLMLKNYMRLISSSSCAWFYFRYENHQNCIVFPFDGIRISGSDSYLIGKKKIISNCPTHSMAAPKEQK